MSFFELCDSTMGKNVGSKLRLMATLTRGVYCGRFYFIYVFSCLLNIILRFMASSSNFDYYKKQKAFSINKSAMQRYEKSIEVLLGSYVLVICCKLSCCCKKEMAKIGWQVKIKLIGVFLWIQCTLYTLSIKAQCYDGKQATKQTRS